MGKQHHRARPEVGVAMLMWQGTYVFLNKRGVQLKLEELQWDYIRVSK